MEKITLGADNKFEGFIPRAENENPYEEKFDEVVSLAHTMLYDANNPLIGDSIKALVEAKLNDPKFKLEVINSWRALEQLPNNAMTIDSMQLAKTMLNKIKQDQRSIN